MTDSIVWGPEIQVNGKRPEWLDERSYVDLHSLNGTRWYSEGTSGLGVGTEHIGWKNVKAIRLPADHPHYRQPTAPERDPALWDRMVAFVRRCDDLSTAKCFVGKANGHTEEELAIEARAIVADLPKPVDPDEQYAADLIRAHGWQDQGPIGEMAVLAMIAKAHREGRELSRQGDAA